VATVPFCPNPLCENHLEPLSPSWYFRNGTHKTKTFGSVPRFLCRSCGKTFSTQTFSIDYYAKKVVDYRDLLTRHAHAESVRALGRGMHLSCGSVLNRFDRLSRQAVALHAELRPLALAREDTCADGFVSFDVSQFFPNEITLSITASSRFILDLSHATRKRSGSMTPAQKARADELYAKAVFERGAVSRSFADILSSLARERPPAPHRPLVLITDEKKEYEQALHRSALWREQDEEHRVAHLRINSRLPRTFQNPLFPSNYLDREIRKDQANHHRETTCFCRNVANGMARLACYLVHHNYRKRYLIKAPVGDERVHAEVAGLDRSRIMLGLEAMFSHRVFRSRISLPETLDRIWRKTYPTPLKTKAEYLPAFALG
jgi:transposase-like protein